MGSLDDRAPSGEPHGLLVLAITLTALLAFAANSVLCRLALGEETIDPYSFTAVRIGSGALALWLVHTLRRPARQDTRRGWPGAFFLLAYAIPFSLAYVRLETGTGALLLFAAVQVTMIGHALRSGERPWPLEWLGLVGAAAGVVYLVSPGLSSPDPIGAAFMIVAGVAWGAYSVTGARSTRPLSATAQYFKLAAFLVIPVTALAWPWLVLSPRGIVLAAASGALASGLGYAVWYSALRYVSLTRAALVQLAVPAIAAGGGAAFVGEAITLRLILSSVAILGSIALGIASRRRRV